MTTGVFKEILKRLYALEIVDRNNFNRVNLYNWGEPFLNKDINGILGILKERELQAIISSNFMTVPTIDDGLYSVIKSVVFSLSGFTQKSYEKIHGGKLDEVLENFKGLCESLRKSTSKASITVAWHRYRFNDNEFWSAYRYFDRLGVRFQPAIAFLNDGLLSLDFARGELDSSWDKKLRNDIYVEEIRRSIGDYKLLSDGYRCPEWDTLNIAEDGKLLLCCAGSSRDKEFILGDILEMSADEIWEKKRTNPICKKCVSSGLAKWYFARLAGGYEVVPWPSGGGVSYFKLRSFYLFIRLARLVRGG